MYHGDTLGVFVPVNNLNSSDMSWKKHFEVVGSGESVEVTPVQINGECVLLWFEGGENKFYTLCGKLLTLFSLIINFSSHFIRFCYFVSFHSTYLCLYLYLYWFFLTYLVSDIEGLPLVKYQDKDSGSGDNGDDGTGGSHDHHYATNKQDFSHRQSTTTLKEEPVAQGYVSRQ